MSCLCVVVPSRRQPPGKLYHKLPTYHYNLLAPRPYAVTRLFAGQNPRIRGNYRSLRLGFGRFAFPAPHPLVRWTKPYA